MRTCNDCGEELVVGHNWTQKRKDHKMYLCKPCEKKEIAGRQMYVNGKYIPKSHPLHKPGKYIVSDGILLEATKKVDDNKEGYVYVITNKAWPGWVKIGMAEDVNKRLDQFQTSSPLRDYVMEHFVYAEDRRAAEAQAHLIAASLCLDSHKEWFKLEVKTAINVLDNLHECNGLSEEANSHQKKDELQECIS